MHSPRRPKARSSSTDAKMPPTPFQEDTESGRLQQQASGSRGQDQLNEVGERNQATNLPFSVIPCYLYLCDPNPKTLHPSSFASLKGPWDLEDLEGVR